jgi:hypothetical protein
MNQPEPQRYLRLPTSLNGPAHRVIQLDVGNTYVADCSSFDLFPSTPRDIPSLTPSVLDTELSELPSSPTPTPTPTPTLPQKSSFSLCDTMSSTSTQGVRPSFRVRSSSKSKRSRMWSHTSYLAILLTHLLSGSAAKVFVDEPAPLMSSLKPRPSTGSFDVLSGINAPRTHGYINSMSSIIFRDCVYSPTLFRSSSSSQSPQSL